jgi:hypothetical protein
VTAGEPHTAEKGDIVQILWLLPAPLAKSVAGDRQEQRLLNLNLASARLRGGVASTFALRAGHRNVFLDGDDPAAISSVDLDAIDLCVVTKFFGTSNARLWLEVLGRLVKTKRKVLVDICEYPFVVKKNAAISDFYNKALAYCDVMTVNSSRMQELMAPHLGRAPLVIEDAILESEQKPQFAPGKVLKLLWFGHPTNFKYLADLLPSLKTFSQQQKCQLTIVSSPELKDKVPPVDKKLSAQFSTRFIAWSFQSQRDALADCDLVLIPGDPADPRKSGASSNRIAETLQAGRFPVAAALGSYLPYEQAAWLGRDLIAGIDFALSQPKEVLSRIQRGQVLVKTTVKPSIVGKQWLALFESLTEKKSKPVTPAATRRKTTLKKLNLGCGDKILPGYINVDVAGSRQGRKPDVLCDLRKLKPFADNEVDEILSVHVVEHFWRWEIVDVVKEWVRVLKPGGLMVIECPNLLTACQEIMQNPDIAIGPGKEGRRSMWVLYGDPGWKDPLMMHRWAYTPNSLMQLMREAGLVNLRQEPAQFKLKEPRDMRIVGEKAVV